MSFPSSGSRVRAPSSALFGIRHSAISFYEKHFHLCILMLVVWLPIPVATIYRIIVLVALRCFPYEFLIDCLCEASLQSMVCKLFRESFVGVSSGMYSFLIVRLVLLSKRINCSVWLNCATAPRMFRVFTRTETMVMVGLHYFRCMYCGRQNLSYTHICNNVVG